MLIQRMCIVNSTLFEEWCKDYSDLLFSWAEGERLKGVEYLERAQERRWYQFWKLDRDELFAWATMYLEKAEEYEWEANQILSRVD